MFDTYVKQMEDFLLFLLHFFKIQISFGWHCEIVFSCPEIGRPVFIIK